MLSPGGARLLVAVGLEVDEGVESGGPDGLLVTSVLWASAVACEAAGALVVLSAFSVVPFDVVGSGIPAVSVLAVSVLAPCTSVVEAGCDVESIVVELPCSDVGVVTG